MSTLSDLQQLLLADAQMVNLVADRVYVDEAPAEASMPLVILKQIADRPIRGLDNSLHARQEVVQLESWHERRALAQEVHRAVELVLAGAGMPPDEADPDSLDPDVGARACVWNVDVWT